MAILKVGQNNKFLITNFRKQKQLLRDCWEKPKFELGPCKLLYEWKNQ